ncbi:MAG: ComEC/Rec2 family competence protein, partial [Candidatus Omnitrophica bacterium]|nr:ComEC/Rec2 family competence protein [Candidatus Omnitrophota bacterium]
ESSLLRAMLLGERRDIPVYINDIFIQTGTIHILAISGLNIGIIAFIILIFLKVIRLPRRLRYILTIIFLFLYVFITGSPVSVIRATIMFIVFLSGFLFERESDIFNSLALSCLLILGFNPNQLFDIGFQLSFISLLSIVTFGRKIETQIYKIFPKKNRILSFFWSSNAVSLAAWLGVLGIIAFNFNIITPLAIIANLFIVPFMIVVSALGLSFVAVSLIFPALGFIFANSASLSLFILVKFTYLLSKLPGAYFYLPPLPLFLIFIYYALLLGLFNLHNLMSIFDYFRNRE